MNRILPLLLATMALGCAMVPVRGVSETMLAGSEFESRFGKYDGMYVMAERAIYIKADAPDIGLVRYHERCHALEHKRAGFTSDLDYEDKCHERLGE